jgi:hypothetical protein
MSGLLDDILLSDEERLAQAGGVRRASTLGRRPRMLGGQDYGGRSSPEAQAIGSAILDTLLPPSPEQYLAVQSGYSIPRGAETRMMDSGPQYRDPQTGEWRFAEAPLNIERLGLLALPSIGGDAPEGAIRAGAGRIARRRTVDDTPPPAAPAVRSAAVGEEVAGVDAADANIRAFLDRGGEERTPRVRPLPEGEDVLGLRNYDLTQVPDVPQTDLWRYTPARGVSARMSDLVSNPDVERAYTDLVRHGRDNLQGREWYNMDPLRFRFIEVLGPEEGERAFRDFTQNIAAASPRSNIIDNMRNASYYFSQEASGAPLPLRQPYPYGHLAQNLHRQNVLTIRGDGWNLRSNPKPASFAENLAGNQTPGTMDAHALAVPAILSRDPRFLTNDLRIQFGGGYQNLKPRGSFARGVYTMDEAARRPQLWDSVPNENEYGALENWFRRIGEREGMTTAQTQASGWVGGGRVSGLQSPPLPAAEILQRVVNRTAREMGVEPREVLDRMIMRQQALRAQVPVPMQGPAALLPREDDER